MPSLLIEIKLTAEGEDIMNQKKEVVLKNGCQLVCDKCERERAQRTKSCGVCGCKETKEICLAIPGEEIVPSINIVKESQNQWYV